jgi:limonene-1,2-epoxide hydrolase
VDGWTITGPALPGSVAIWTSDGERLASPALEMAGCRRPLIRGDRGVQANPARLTAMPPPADIASAFSTHDFDVAYPHLRTDVVWWIVGGDEVHGSDEVRALCERTRHDLDGVETRFERLRTLVGDSWVVLDSVATYEGANGVSRVASCDIYEFKDGAVTTITSYNVELEAN